MKSTFSKDAGMKVLSGKRMNKYEVRDAIWLLKYGAEAVRQEVRDV